MARDRYHEHVRVAIEKDGWTITKDPLPLSRGNVDLAVDLGAEKIISAKKGVEYIAIEIKSFRRGSLVYAFHEAVGQYTNYRRVMRKNKMERKLYLAVPQKVYKAFQQEIFYMEAFKDEQIHLLIYNVETKEVISWINN